MWLWLSSNNVGRVQTSQEGECDRGDGRGSVDELRSEVEAEARKAVEGAVRNKSRVFSLHQVFEHPQHAQEGPCVWGQW